MSHHAEPEDSKLITGPTNPAHLHLKSARHLCGDLFEHLAGIRPWGPEDRLSGETQAAIGAGYCLVF